MLGPRLESRAQHFAVSYVQSINQSINQILHSALVQVEVEVEVGAAAAGANLSRHWAVALERQIAKDTADAQAVVSDKRHFVHRRDEARAMAGELVD